MKALRAWLDSSNTTQQALADKVGVKPPTVSQWLSGVYFPSTKKLLELSRITGLSMEQLLADKAPPPASDGQPQAAA